MLFTLLALGIAFWMFHNYYQYLSDSLIMQIVTRWILGRRSFPEFLNGSPVTWTFTVSQRFLSFSVKTRNVGFSRLKLLLRMHASSQRQQKHTQFAIFGRYGWQGGWGIETIWFSIIVYSRCSGTSAQGYRHCWSCFFIWPFSEGRPAFAPIKPSYEGISRPSS